MAKAPRYEIPRSANLTASAMRSAIPLLKKRIEELRSFDINVIQEESDPRVAALEQKINTTLQGILGNDTAEYNDYNVWLKPTSYGGLYAKSLSEIIGEYRKRFERDILKLSSLKDLFEEKVADSSDVDVAIVATVTNKNTRRVFVVHGHDDGTKETVARFLSKIDLEPIILHEQPNQGRTIIEKFEGHSAVDYAVVICTADDTGASAKDPSNLKPRPRQNVILELGFFMGSLGRKKVCVLHTEGVELPSDYDGVLFVPLDAAGAWRWIVAREMKSMGIDVDLNKVM